MILMRIYLNGQGEMGRLLASNGMLIVFINSFYLK